MKRVLLLSQYVAAGGLERLVMQHSLQLKRRGNIAPVIFAYDISQTQDQLLAEYNQSGIPVLHFPKGRGFSLLTVLRILFTLLRLRIRVIHTHDIGPLIYGCIVRRISLGFFRVVHTQHSDVTLGNNLKHQEYHRVFSKQTNRLCAVSESVRESYKNIGLDPQNITIVTNGILPVKPPLSLEDRLRARSKLLKEIGQPDIDAPRWMLCLGRVSPQKGHPNLLKLWELLPDKEKWKLVIVGPEQSPGYLDELKKLAKEGVFIYGPSSQPESWLASADLFISASESEGMPLASIEALANNVPIFLSQIPGHRFLSPWARFFSLENLDEAAVTLSELLRSIENSKTLIHTSAEVLREFSLDSMTARYETIYKLAYLSGDNS